MFAFSILFFAYLVRVFEQPYFKYKADGELDHFFNAVWLMVISVTTVGYGDLFAHTFMGKSVSICAVLWGSFLTSFVVVAISSSLTHTQDEQLAMTEIEATN